MFIIIEYYSNFGKKHLLPNRQEAKPGRPYFKRNSSRAASIRAV